MFSVIIPTYKEEKYLPRLLDSIREQLLQPDEIIVADRPSGDRTRAIARSYGCKVVEGGDISFGRNQGAKYATQDILIFLDADTELSTPKFFNKLLGGFITSNSDVGTSFVTCDDDGAIADKIMHEFQNLNKGFNSVTAKAFNNILAELGCCVICKKSLFDKIGGFDEKMLMMEDTDFYRRAVKSGGKYIVIPVRLRISERRFAKRSIYSNIKIVGFLGAILVASFFGMKEVSRLRRRYEEEKGPLGG